MTQALLVIALLAQAGETPVVPAGNAEEKTAEPAPAPVPAAAPAPATVPPSVPAATPVKPESPPVPPRKPTSAPAFAAAGVTEGLSFLLYGGINSALGAGD